MSGSPNSVSPLPNMVIAHEDYALFDRLLTSGVSPQLEGRIENRLGKATVTQWNTVGEIRGSTWPGQVVILGAHLDSWDLGTGVTDKACRAPKRCSRPRARPGARFRRSPRRPGLQAPWHRTGPCRTGREGPATSQPRHRHVQLEGLDGSHWRAGDLHVKCRWRTAKEHWGAGSDHLCHRDPGQHVDRVKDRRADGRDGGNQPLKRHRHDLDRDPGLDAVNQVLARILAVPEIAAGGDGEDGHRTSDQVGTIRSGTAVASRPLRDTVLGEGAGDDRPLRVREASRSRQASDTLASMSSLVEKAVARYAMCERPSASLTYSTKSVVFARRTSPVRWSMTLSPDEPGTKWTRSSPRSACGLPSRSNNEATGPSRSPARRSRAERAPARRSRSLAARPPKSSPHLCAADLHAGRGEDAQRLIKDPLDQ